ncbi:MAG: hypothetical protein KC684_09545 [Candidatus Omnitrophica bacterium]|nr:hypothetical protein [Candidatus Omnitrophota bacterium]
MTKTMSKEFNLLIIPVLFSAGFFILSSDAETLKEYCQKQFEEHQVCPEETCYQLSCLEEPCDEGCHPKSCLEIEPEHCPLSACRLLMGCNDTSVCYPLSKQDTPECGTNAYEGQDVECCEGFIKRCGVEFFDGTCDMIGKGSIDSVPICLPCGNGICNQFENRCNCPEDCKN